MNEARWQKPARSKKYVSVLWNGRAAEEKASKDARSQSIVAVMDGFLNYSFKCILMPILWYFYLNFEWRDVYLWQEYFYTVELVLPLRHTGLTRNHYLAHPNPYSNETKWQVPTMWMCTHTHTDHSLNRLYFWADLMFVSGLSCLNYIKLNVHISAQFPMNYCVWRSTSSPVNKN